MRLLLDTHLLLWSLEGDTRLSQVASDLILDPHNEIFVSSMALWEIAIKSQLGKLRADAGLIRQNLPLAGFETLPFTADHAICVGTLAPLHRDPFDRAMLAQAITEPMTLLTHDPRVAAYGSMARLV